MGGASVLEMKGPSNCVALEYTLDAGLLSRGPLPVLFEALQGAVSSAGVIKMEGVRGPYVSSPF